MTSFSYDYMYKLMYTTLGLACNCDSSFGLICALTVKNAILVQSIAATGAWCTTDTRHAHPTLVGVDQSTTQTD